MFSNQDGQRKNIGYEIQIEGWDQPTPVKFVNRENEIAKILRYLAPNAAPQGILLYGQGGIGKSTTAAEAAIRAWENGYYDLLLFLTAKFAHWDLGRFQEFERPRRGRFRFASFNGMLHSLGQVLGSPPPKDHSQNARLASLKQVLTDKKALLIIDNLDALPSLTDPSEISKFEELINFHLPKGNKAIITSRNVPKGLTRHGLVEIGLNPFEKSAAYSLLESLAVDQGVEIPTRQIPTLLFESDGVPLVLKQVVPLIANYGPSNVIEPLRSIKKETLLPYIFGNATSAISRNGFKTLAAIAIATFAVTLEKLRTMTNLSHSELDESIRELDNWSLILKTGDTYDVHYLLEEFVINQIKQDPETWQAWKEQVRLVEEF